MYQTRLINMPSAALDLPTIALTQLKSVLDTELDHRLSVDILDLHRVFGRHMGIDGYHYGTGSAEATNAGLGHWLFRKTAFPELGDNTEACLQRYSPYPGDHIRPAVDSIPALSGKLDPFSEGLIDRHELAAAQLVGFSSMFAQKINWFALARKLKDRNPGIITLMGGANCETPMGEQIVLNLEPIDDVFSGPARKRCGQHRIIHHPPRTRGVGSR